MSITLHVKSFIKIIKYILHKNAISCEYEFQLIIFELLIHCNTLGLEYHTHL